MILLRIKSNVLANKRGISSYTQLGLTYRGHGIKVVYDSEIICFILKHVPNLNQIPIHFQARNLSQS